MFDFAKGQELVVVVREGRKWKTKACRFDRCLAGSTIAVVRLDGGMLMNASVGFLFATKEEAGRIYRLAK